MAMTAASARARLVAKLSASGKPTITDGEFEAVDELLEAIIEEIQANATVTGATGTGAPGGPLPIALPGGSVS